MFHYVIFVSVIIIGIAMTFLFEQIKKKKSILLKKLEKNKLFVIR